MNQVLKERPRNKKKKNLNNGQAIPGVFQLFDVFFCPCMFFVPADELFDWMSVDESAEETSYHLPPLVATSEDESVCFFLTFGWGQSNGRLFL